MRILALVTDAFGGYGGIAKFNRDLITALCSHPHCDEVVAIPRVVLHEIGSLPTSLQYLSEAAGCKLTYISAIMRYLARRSSHSLIICGHLNLLPLAFFTKWFSRVSIALVIHGIEAWNPSKSLIVNTLAGRIDFLISVSELTKRRFLAWARVDHSIGYLLPNSVELHQFTPGPKSPELLDRYGLNGKVVLMTLGRLVGRERAKGFDEVIEILPSLTVDIPDITYLIVGYGKDRLRLEQKASQLGLQDRVLFTGFVPEEEKVEHYRLADAFVMPSQGEGFGIVLLEAMACGIPVVVSSADGSREAIREGMFGIMVDPSSKLEIRNGIIEALKRPKGVVPVGLDYFSYQSFQIRCHQIVDEILGLTRTV